MSNRSLRFGSPERFQVVLEWLRDDEPVVRRPKVHGWSMARLELTIAGLSLTAHAVGDERRSAVVWYLGPFLHWLTDNWIFLFHEEQFAWTEKSEGAAAEVSGRALALFATIGEAAAAELRSAESWCRRHGMVEAAAGGLFPDVFIRRVGEDVELSWTGSPPPFAPEGFVFDIEPGAVRMAVSEVAEPLWNLLDQVRHASPKLKAPSFVADWDELVSKIDLLEVTSAERFGRATMREALLDDVMASYSEVGRVDLVTPIRSPKAPYVPERPLAGVLFGGVTVHIQRSDIDRLRDVMIGAEGHRVVERLSSIIRSAPFFGKPWQDGYDLAEELLEILADSELEQVIAEFVDIREICQAFDVEILEAALETDTVRGVALAGENYRPTILLNTTSMYNSSEEGRRFTIAHELCHILHDQTRARKIAHISGAWAAPGVEKRANAFAAWLLMPPRLLLHRCLGVTMTIRRLKRIAKELRVTEGALLEHLHNIGFIGEIVYDGLWRSIAGRRRSIIARS